MKKNELFGEQKGEGKLSIFWKKENLPRRERKKKERKRKKKKRGKKERKKKKFVFFFFLFWSSHFGIKVGKYTNFHPIFCN